MGHAEPLENLAAELNAKASNPDSGVRGFTTGTMLDISPNGKGASIQWISAGHLPPVLVTPSRTCFLPSRVVEGDGVRDLPFGILTGMKYTLNEVIVEEPRFFLVTMSDGGTELSMSSGGLLGSRAIPGHVSSAVRELQNHCSALAINPWKIVDAMRKTLNTKLGSRQRRDDAALAVLMFRVRQAQAVHRNRVA